MDNSVFIYEGSIQSALERFLGDYPEIRGAFMGTRYTDPGACEYRYSFSTYFIFYCPFFCYK